MAADEPVTRMDWARVRAEERRAVYDRQRFELPVQRRACDTCAGGDHLYGRCPCACHQRQETSNG